MLTIVLYHHIGQESDFERGLNITTRPEVFAAQIKWISARFNFVSLEQLIAGALPARPLLLTFDDAFLSVLEAARDILAPQGIPAVFFVNPSLLAEGAISLDSVLAWSANKYGLGRLCAEVGVEAQATLSDLIIGEMSKYSAKEREEIRRRILIKLGPQNFSDRAPLLSARHLEELATLGVELGNHTSTHVHCRSLTSREIEWEITDAKKQLEELSGKEVRSFSIPYGHEDDLTQPVIEAARSSGHRATFLVHARANKFRPAPDIWYRTSIQNQMPRDLNKHLRILPVARSIKKALVS